MGTAGTWKTEGTTFESLGVTCVLVCNVMTGLMSGFSLDTQPTGIGSNPQLFCSPGMWATLRMLLLGHSELTLVI